MLQPKSKRLIVISIFSAFTLSACSNSPEKKIVVDIEKCEAIKSSIANISKEIKDMQIQEASDNSAPRASMRASRMTFGAIAQKNLISLGKLSGCDLVDISLPESIFGGEAAKYDGSL